MSVRRALGAAVLAVLSVTGLTACQTHVGLAASVDGVRLTDSQLNGYVQPGVGPYVDQSSGSTVVPKLFALEAWLRVQILDATIRGLGGARRASETRAAQALLLGSTTPAQAEQSYVKQGYTARLGDLIVDESTALVVLVERIEPGATPQQALQDVQNSSTQQSAFNAVAKANAKVVVSPRYGAWNAKTLSLSSDPRSGLPPFVSFGTTAATS